jgi:alkylation response protein AidB-like acyl-CoA dehydrogenase
MDLSPTDEQQHLADIVGRFLAKSSSPEQVRAAEPLGFDRAVWDGFGEIGTVAMGVPESVGGADAALADLAVVAREAGAALAPAPIVEAMVAARLLARFDGRDQGWLDGVLGGDKLLTIAVRPAVDGRAALVPGAAVADAVLLLDGDVLALSPVPGAGVAPANLATAPLADVDGRAHGRVELADSAAAHAAYETAVDEWRALTAAWLAGLARRALDIGRQYVLERQQFGVPIASFQAIQQRLADVATATDGADLLAAKAIWSLDEGEPIAGRFAAMAFTFAADAAEASASASLHFHGGYGFMEEYDVQLYFRRAKATRLLLGDPRRELQLVADRLFPGDEAPTTTRADLAPVDPARERRGPEFRLTEAEEGFRREVRAFLVEHVTDEVIERAHATGTIHDWGLHKAMAAQGWVSAAWPVDVGGQGRSPLEVNALSEEMYLSGAPVDGIGVAALVAHTLLLEGTDWQKRTVIPKILSGDKIACLGYSEPDAGSDVAACATKAERDGDQWIINGQKMFTTLAHEAGYVFLLTRTNTEVPKHKGLTMFVVPMDLPGIEITPVHTMGGERTNITFYSDLRVDDRYRVGEVDGGWAVMMTALVFERNGSWYGELVRLLDHAAHWAASATGDDGRPRIADPLVRERLARAAIGNEVANLLGWRAAWLQSIGRLPSVEGSMAKLWVTEHYQRAASDLLDLLGAEGLRQHGESGAPAGGWIEQVYRHCQVTTIYGGTSEIQRNIIAQRGLGLPRGQ